MYLDMFLVLNTSATNLKQVLWERGNTYSGVIKMTEERSIKHVVINLPSAVLRGGVNFQLAPRLLASVYY